MRHVINLPIIMMIGLFVTTATVDLIGSALQTTADQAARQISLSSTFQE